MPRGKSKASLALVDTAVEILSEIQPATVRAVCYRLFTAGLIPDMRKRSTNKVGVQLVWAREQGMLPWGWIVDETREAERAQQWASTDEIIDAAVRGYRRDYWQDQPNWLEVWSEKGTVRGTLAPVLWKYGVTFRVMHGYGSATALHDIASESSRSDKPLTVFYVGDFDCSGMHMSEVDIPKRIQRYNGAATIRRIVSRYGNRCWELDALSPVTLRQRVEDAIADMIDADTWNRSLMVERAEVEAMQSYSEQLKRSISGQASKYIAMQGARP